MTSTLEIPVADPSARTIVNIVGESDLLRVRSTMRAYARQAGLGLTATTKAVTASSELARNILRYATGGQGTAVIEEASSGQKTGDIHRPRPGHRRPRPSDALRVQHGEQPRARASRQPPARR
jgi:hypothetical protein